MYNQEQIINGLINYTENEIISKMPTVGKIVDGNVVGIGMKNIDGIITNLKTNPLIKTLGVIDESGMIDVDTILDSLKQSAVKYGNVIIKLPYMGDLTLTAQDVDLLRNYIR